MMADPGQFLIGQAQHVSKSSPQRRHGHKAQARFGADHGHGHRGRGQALPKGRYLTQNCLLALIAGKKMFHPLVYAKDRGLKRFISTRLITLNYWRKYREHYPKPTASGY